MIYDLLEDSRSSFIGPKHWMGNLRWFAEETDSAGIFVFRTAPINAGECDLWRPNLLVAANDRTPEQAEFTVPRENREPPAACRTFFGLQMRNLQQVRRVLYKPDSVKASGDNGSFSLLLPHDRYGALIEVSGLCVRPLRISSRREIGRLPLGERAIAIARSPGQIMWTDGAYTLVFRHNGSAIERDGGGFDLLPTSGEALRLAVSFHAEPRHALDEADALFSDPEGIRHESRTLWEDYLASCPVAQWERDFIWVTPDGEKVTCPADEIRRRQYWHWHCLLSNVFDLPFNDLRAFVAPDKANWFGVWSNDGPECLRALSRTNRHRLARTCLVEYVRTAIDARGDHSWYLHGTGIGCLGNPGDSGVLSNGVPAIVTAVADYVEFTGDATILDEPAGAGGSVREKLDRYLEQVFRDRDKDGDGLVEWANLWEGGPDDKVGPFFSRTDIKEWIVATTTLNEEELADFYRRNLMPVTNLYEQQFFLDALDAWRRLCLRLGDRSFAQYVGDRYQTIVDTLENRHWDESEGFYYDWDVTERNLIRIKNQDAFYLASHLRNPDRTTRLFAHLDNPDEFALLYTPTLARNEPGFNPDGYWCGGYWPREAAYIGRALIANGHRQAAETILVKALCAAQGKTIPENMNPLTGTDNTHITGMAYNINLVTALLMLEQRA